MSKADQSIRVVLDTNVLLRSLVNSANASRQIVAACESRQIVILLSKPVIDEYRRVLIHLMDRDASITFLQVEALLRRLRYLGEYFRHVSASFAFPRDPTDAKLVELAIEGEATHILTYDNDLLSLPKSRTEAGKRFRQRLRGTQITRPDDLMRSGDKLGPAGRR